MDKFVGVCILSMTFLFLGCSGGSNKVEMPKGKHEIPKSFSAQSEKSGQDKSQNTGSIKLNN